MTKGRMTNDERRVANVLHFRKIAICLFVLISQSLVAAETECAPTNTLGIVNKRPAEGRFVEIDSGFMVPYTATIPGTDVQFTMMPIPGGKHQVTRDGVTYVVAIKPFWMAKTEVTWAEYREFMKLNDVFEKFKDFKIRQAIDADYVDAVTAPSTLYDASWVYETGGTPLHPAVSMRQYAAKQYTKWLSLLSEQFYRLPSEAEWEYACLAGAKTAYHYGDDPAKLIDYAWCFDQSTDPTSGKVATKLPNAWGLHDMHGNVAEWVLDSVNTKVKPPAEGSTISVENAIRWPSEEFGRITKGGSWDTKPEECTYSSRMLSNVDWFNQDPDYPRSPFWMASDESQLIGFRIMRPLQVPDRAQREPYWQADVPEMREALERRVNKEGRGERGMVDPTLPEAIKNLPASNR